MSSNRFVELIKKLIRGLMNMGGSSDGPGGPGGDDQPRTTVLDLLVEKMEEKKESALEDEQLLEAFMLESQIATFKEINALISENEIDPSNLDEISKRTESVIKGKISELSSDKRYEELMADYMAFDPRNIDKVSSKIMNDMMPEIMEIKNEDAARIMASIMGQTCEQAVIEVRKKSIDMGYEENPFRDDSVTKGKFNSLQIGLMGQVKESVKNNDVERAMAIEVVRLSLLRLESSDYMMMDKDAQNSLSTLEIIKDAAYSVNYHIESEPESEAKNMESLVAITQCSEFNEVLEEEKQSIITNVKTMMFEGHEQTVIETIDEVSGQIIDVSAQNSQNAENTDADEDENSASM